MIESGNQSAQTAEKSGFEWVVAGWAQLGEHACLIRDEVFIEEQHVPADIERDHDDATCLHIVVYTTEGEPVATGRIVVQSRGESLPGPVGRIGRLAVRKPFRGKGLAKQMLHTLIAKARLTGLTQFELHARVQAQPLYERFGFTPRASEFDEAGAAHILMVKDD